MRQDSEGVFALNTDKFRYRLTYTKGEGVKYISHLDFLRSINRAFKRAKMPVAYSNGFNPHILLNIALPCPVGVTSECEMLDIELTHEMPTDEMTNLLNSVLMPDIRIVAAVRVKEEPDFSLISSALYDITFKSETEFSIQGFFDEESVIIEKKSKRGMKEVNIKDFIKNISLSYHDGTSYGISAELCAGGKANLKPELLISAIEDFCKAKMHDIKIKREKIFFGQDLSEINK